MSYNKTFTFPFKFEIPNYISNFIESKSSIRLRFKYLKRYLYIYINQQKSHEIFQISDSHKNILWINFSAPSLGDSLMDLSSRIMLRGRNIDLLTNKKNASLYLDDSIFSSVFIDKKNVIKKNYDLIIIDSYSTRSIKLKIEVAKFKPYVGMYGYFNGPEVNRVLFSFHQMNSLLGNYNTENEINSMAKCSISISSEDQKLIKKIGLPKNFIAIVLGGEWSYRTFKYWDKVIEQLLIKDQDLKIVLLGSNNANESEKYILEKYPIHNLISYVARYTFNQTTEIIRQSSLTFCCDGGLMHAANSFEVSIIPLFARLDAKMQLTQLSNALPLFDSKDVNNISIENILIKYDEAFNFGHIYPQNE